MTLNKNAEGYRDNTAGSALFNLSHHHIRFTYGVMDINLSSFFPCHPRDAQALLKLVEMYCSPEDKTMFLTFLRTKAKQMQERLVRLETVNDHSQYIRQELVEVKRLYRLLLRNIELFETMEVQS